MYKRTVGMMMLIASTNSFGEDADMVMSDPTRPTQFVDSGVGKKSTQVDDSKLDLEGIVISGDYRAAIINNKILLVGSKIGSYKVIFIKEDSVILEGKTGSNVVLDLLSDMVKEDVK